MPAHLMISHGADCSHTQTTLTTERNDGCAVGQFCTGQRDTASSGRNRSAKHDVRLPECTSKEPRARALDACDFSNSGKPSLQHYQTQQHPYYQTHQLQREVKSYTIRLFSRLRTIAPKSKCRQTFKTKILSLVSVALLQRVLLGVDHFVCQSWQVVRCSGS